MFRCDPGFFFLLALTTTPNCNTGAIDSSHRLYLAWPKSTVTSMAKFEMFRNQTDAESFPAHATIFEKGDPRTFMYVVQSGEVEIRLGNRVLEVVGPDGIFGEMAMVDGQPRTAAAVARTDCKLVPIDQKRFQFLIQQTPFFALEVMRVLLERLRRADQLVEA
jgi:CRP/FNR family transcriptional regulator, cyclic AMP receptor protein